MMTEAETPKANVSPNWDSPKYTRRYVKADPTSHPEWRRFQVGERVYLVHRYTHPNWTYRLGTVVSHDRYWVEQTNGGFIKQDSYYTVQFDDTGTTRSYLEANYLEKADEYEIIS